LEAARSNTRGNGWAPSGPTSPLGALLPAGAARRAPRRRRGSRPRHGQGGTFDRVDAASGRKAGRKAAYLELHASDQRLCRCLGRVRPAPQLGDVEPARVADLVAVNGELLGRREVVVHREVGGAARLPAPEVHRCVARVHLVRVRVGVGVRVRVRVHLVRVGVGVGVRYIGLGLRRTGGGMEG
jgi:hypothetical protein